MAHPMRSLDRWQSLQWQPLRWRKLAQTFVQTHPDAIAAIACAVCLLLAWLALYWQWTGLALFLLPIAYVVGGYESAREGLTTLFQEKELDVDLLMIVAALGAAGLGLWRQEYYLMVDGAVLILIFAISGALESYAMQRTERSIRSLMSLTPDTGRVLNQTGEEQVAIDRLQVGDVLLVKPGERIPTDSVIVDGFSLINQAAITGEAIPVEKTVGDEVFGGTLNGNGALKLQVDQPPASSLIQRVIRLVEQAQNEAPPSQQFIERFERGYAKVIVVTGVLLALLPPVLWNWSWSTTIYRALIFLVVASPCALMAAIMPTLLSGIANGARQGILFKNGAQLELIGQVRSIAFDKTGTLTLGQPIVDTVLPAAGYTEVEVLAIAAALESHSEHPIAQAITTAAQKPQRYIAHNIQAHPGLGITGQLTQRNSQLEASLLEAQSVVVGQLSFVRPLLQDFSESWRSQANTLEQAGHTVIWVVRSQQIVGLIAIADQVRPEAARAIAQLKRLGIERVIMLTGDNQTTAASVAQAVGITEVHAELRPEDKLHLIRQLQQRDGSVAMVGDGINDAPALAQATVGIAMGVAGSDVALETADIVLMSDRLDRITTAVRLGRRSQTVVKQNIIFALGFIVLLLVANFAGTMTLPIGVIGHEGSTVLVTLSGLRLLRN